MTRGMPHNPSGWSTAPAWGTSGQLYGTVPNFPSGQKTLFAKCQRSGHNDSAVVQWNL